MSGFVYIWCDRKHNRYYIGSHWGPEDDGYICSSAWMKQAYKHRPNDFKRRIISRVLTSRSDLLIEEQRWLDMIKPIEIKSRYYNLKLKSHGVWHTNESSKLTVGEKISRAKKGKNTGKRDSSIGEKISEVKKKKFEKRREETGSAFTPEHIESMSKSRTGKTQSQDSNEKRSSTLKQKYESGELIARTDPLSEETKNKISLSLTGIKRSDDTKSKMSKSQSKTYIITFINGDVKEVKGLKAFCSEQSIPYVTARKAFETGSSIKKYHIQNICLAP